MNKYAEEDESFDLDDSAFANLNKKPAKDPSQEGQTDGEDWNEEFGLQEVIENNQHSMAQGFKHLIKEAVEFGQIGEETSLRLSMEKKNFQTYSIPAKCRIVTQLLQGKGHCGM